MEKSSFCQFVKLCWVWRWIPVKAGIFVSDLPSWQGVALQNSPQLQIILFLQLFSLGILNPSTLSFWIWLLMQPEVIVLAVIQTSCPLINTDKSVCSTGSLLSKCVLLLETPCSQLSPLPGQHCSLPIYSLWVWVWSFVFSYAKNYLVIAMGFGVTT